VLASPVARLWCANRLRPLLQGVEHEQHHLQLRATRHLKTVKSTHRRTLVYYLAIYAAIVVSSFLQASGTRPMH
jgi:emp24/gp25L/p24 family/GOLD